MTSPEASAAPDITAAAVEAAAKALWDWTINEDGTEPWEDGDAEDLDRCLEVARIALEAAVPVLLASHEKQVREQVAQHIKDFAQEAAKTDSPDAIIGLFAARSIVLGKSFHVDELDGVITAGESAAIARGSRPAADSGGGE